MSTEQDTTTDDSAQRTALETIGPPRPYPTANACGATGCEETNDLAPATHSDRGTRVLCPYHRRHYLGVSS